MGIGLLSEEEASLYKITAQLIEQLFLTFFFIFLSFYVNDWSMLTRSAGR